MDLGKPEGVCLGVMLNLSFAGRTFLPGYILQAIHFEFELDTMVMPAVAPLPYALCLQGVVHLFDP